MYTLHFDGCSKSNPGKSGAGAVLYDQGVEVDAWSSFVGEHKTNNEAEYSGLLLGLQKCLEKGVKQVIVKGDSLLVIRQMNGKYQVKSVLLLPLYKQAIEISSLFESIVFTHVYRNDNKRADELSNIGCKIEL
jgi:ribonuclease HI